jgi:uncharacterized membrane protein
MFTFGMYFLNYSIMSCFNSIKCILNIFIYNTIFSIVVFLKQYRRKNSHYKQFLKWISMSVLVDELKCCVTK